MSVQTYSLEEQETTINISAINSKIADIYSSVPSMIRKIRKLFAEHPDEVTIDFDHQTDIYATVPASWIKISPKRVLNLTDEQKKERAERMRSISEARKSK